MPCVARLELGGISRDGAVGDELLPDHQPLPSTVSRATTVVNRISVNHRLTGPRPTFCRPELSRASGWPAPLSRGAGYHAL